MYNRYVPQSDGSFRRSRIPEPMVDTMLEKSVEKQMDTPEENAEPIRMEQTDRNSRSEIKQVPNKARQDNVSVAYFPNNVGSFLKGLLPNNFDTEDLIVVLLLLLMSGSTRSDHNAALLTLAIYLFM